MSAVTYSEKTYAAPRPARDAVAAKAPARAAGTSFFRRVLDAVVAARAEQARDEYDRYVQVNGRDPIV